jgi:hypothetical protein
MYPVINVWVDENNKQVGARLFVDGKPKDFTLKELHKNFKGSLSNALITDKGLRGKKGVHLKRRLSERNTDKGKPLLYTLMHKDTVVFEVYQECVTIKDSSKIPFELRNILLKKTDTMGEIYKVVSFYRWLEDRVNHLSREYMNKVYIKRKVGRDRERILKDSCAVSVTDNFWVLRSDLKTSWSELREVLDTSLSLVNTALTGDIEYKGFDKTEKDTTSIFSIKGFFPKAIHKGVLLKQGYTAEYEVLAMEIANYLGILVAQSYYKENGVVASKLFTSSEKSLVHAKELLIYLGYTRPDESISNDDEVHEIVYNYFKSIRRTDITRDLERLYLLTYIIGNEDLHEENFGFLYSNTRFENGTFKILEVSPAYDFNNAFSISTTYSPYKWIAENANYFLSNNKDIEERLSSSKFKKLVENLKHLNDKEKKAILIRVSKLLKEV